MNASLSTPSVSFTPEFLRFAEAAIALDKSQRLTPMAVAIADVTPAAPVKPSARKTRSDKGVKRGPRKSAVKPSAPVKRTSKPTVKPDIEPPTIAKVRVTRDTPTTIGSHEFVRLIACELALMAEWGNEIADVVDGYSTIEWVPTIGDVRDRYSMLGAYCEAINGSIRADKSIVKLEFGRNSALYAEAAKLAA